jgi:hypothetical protein
MHFSNLDCVICQEVVPNELKIFRFCEKSKNLSIKIQELFLRRNLASSKFFFQVFEKFRIFGWSSWLAGNNKGVFWTL